MTKIDFNNSHFVINIELNGSLKSIKVSSEETTDGVTYFKCQLETDQITEIRPDINGGWEQIWGKLDPKTVTAIGAAINDHIA